MKVPVYAHRFASVPSKWLDIPPFLAEGWTGDVPEDGGNLIPATVRLGEALLVANPAWRQFSHPVDRRSLLVRLRNRLRVLLAP